LHYLHNNILVIDQSEYIEDRPVPGPFPAFPMTKREKPWERGCDHAQFRSFEREWLVRGTFGDPGHFEGEELVFSF
jgi:hypothetical protein